jgi:DNA replication and repair protein RecF
MNPMIDAAGNVTPGMWFIFPRMELGKLFVRIKHLWLKNTRVYEQVEIYPHPHLNIIVGDNAQGKTTLLEAIYLLGFTKSHRTLDEKELMRDTGFAKIGCLLEKDKDIQLELIISDEGKTVKHNDIKEKRLSDYVGILKTVMFAPEDLELLKGSPKGRRQFLDLQSGVFNKTLLRELTTYKQILKERNARLKQIKSVQALKEDALFSVLSQRLIQSAEYIINERKIFLEAINEHLIPIYESIAHDQERPTLIYQPSLGSEGIESALNRMIEKDYYAQTTTAGPHRDDFIVMSQNKDWTSFASQGQLRTLGIALKLALVKLIKLQENEYPIILLDDVLSELDENRQNLLLNQLESDSQVFITSTDIKSIQLENLNDYALFKVHGRKVERL